MHFCRLIPELYCSDIERSKAFYTALGFTLCYARPEEGFAFLEYEGAQLMIEQPTGRTWLAGEFVRPYGRGVNFQIATQDAGALYSHCMTNAWPIFLPLEEKWYRRDDQLMGCRQFIVQDPDGYLLRFAEDLGIKPLGM